MKAVEELKDMANAIELSFYLTNEELNLLRDVAELVSACEVYFETLNVRDNCWDDDIHIGLYRDLDEYVDEAEYKLCEALEKVQAFGENDE